MDNCVFCKIIKGEIPSYKVWEDDNYLAFLSAAPHHAGHTLLIPKRHQDYFFDLEDQELSELMLKAKPLAQKLKRAFKPKSGKVGLVVAGLGVPHIHLHLIPMDNEMDLSFGSARHNVTPAEFIQVLKLIV